MDLCASAIVVEMDETEDENDGWPKVTQNLVSYIVATWQGNLFPSVLSLTPESTLVTAGHVSARF